MKKLILLLLPALLLTACHKEPEIHTHAKALAGTYTYTRVGSLKSDFYDKHPYQVNMNVSGTAVITYDGYNMFTITLSDGCVIDGFVSDGTNTESYASPRLVITQNAGSYDYFYDFAFEFDGSGLNWGNGNSGEVIAHVGTDVLEEDCAYDIYQNILLHEKYSADIDFPNGITSSGAHGSGLLSFTRQ